MTDELVRQAEARHIASKHKKKAEYAVRLLDIYRQAEDKDYLIIHNPGGWGNKPLQEIQPWEMSILNGIQGLIESQGKTCLLTQYYRTRRGWWEILKDVREHVRFFNTKAKAMAAWVEFLTRHRPNLKVILIGISIGAAFSNSAMQQLNGASRIYSIELGMFSVRRSRRVVTKQILTLDSNGIRPDATMEWNIIDMARAFFAAPFRWLKHRLRGRKVKFSHCINSPGHDYDWSYPEVQQEISQFIEATFNQH